MQDLNDLYYFAQVVHRGGFAAAGRALGIPKSRLSRRIALLEQRLGVRLIQRSTRRFSVTEIGQAYYRHCRAVIAEADAAQAVIDSIRAEPRGQVRVSCPVLLAETRLSQLLPGFMETYPRVRVVLEATNRRVDVIEEGFDLAIRVRPTPLEDSGLVMRSFGYTRLILVASPKLLDRKGRPHEPEDLSALESLGMTAPDGRHVWQLIGPDGGARQIIHHPRLITDDLITLRAAAMTGLGVVSLPEYLCREEIERGGLEVVLDAWSPPLGNVHAVFPSRQGLLPAVRVFIDYLAAHLPKVLAQVEGGPAVPVAPGGDRIELIPGE